MTASVSTDNKRAGQKLHYGMTYQELLADLNWMPPRSGKPRLVSPIFPKAEMHVHPNIALSTAHFVEHLRRDYLAGTTTIPLDLGFIFKKNRRYYRDLSQFHGTYESVRGNRNVADVAEATHRYLYRIAREGAIYAEISATFRGEESFAPMMEAFNFVIDNIRKETPLDTRVVATALRDRGPDEALNAARYIADNKNRFPNITSFGLVGDESKHSLVEFKRAFEVAVNEAGLGLTPHVGEQHPYNVADFLEALPEEAKRFGEKDSRRLRVGHGTMIHVSSDMIKAFTDLGLCIETCLSANKRIGIPEATACLQKDSFIESRSGKFKFRVDRGVSNYFCDLSQHPLPEFLENGIPVCLGADDPLLLNTNIGKEYSLFVKRMLAAGLTQQQSEVLLLEVTRNAIRNSGLIHELRQQKLAIIDGYALKMAA